MFPARAAHVVARSVALRTGVTLRVAIAGPSDGLPVVMLPGWGASLYMYRHALELLPPHGVRAIAVDLRGMGLSDKPPGRNSYSLNAQLADVDALIDELDVKRPVLVGQSMGGAIALHHALRHPDRVSRLVLINPAGLVPIPVVTLGRLAPPPMLSVIGRRAAPRWVIALILRRLAYADPSCVTQRDIDEYWAPTQLPGFIPGVRAALGEFDWSPLSASDAQALAVPTMVILGNEDRLIHNSTASAARLANSRVWRTTGGHCVHEEHPGAVYAEIARFLHEGDGRVPLSATMS